MKKRYYFFLSFIIASYFVLIVLLKGYLPLKEWITICGTLGGTFVAISAAIIALGIAEKPRKFVNFTVNIEVDRDQIMTYSQDGRESEGLSSKKIKEIIEAGFQEVCRSYKVYFNITNTSGFTLTNPVITFELPKEFRYPAEWDTDIFKWVYSYSSNLFDIESKGRILEYEDKIVISNPILPFLNDRQEVKIWIRMGLSEDDRTKYPVRISLNCGNREGKTESKNILPRELLEGI